MSCPYVSVRLRVQTFKGAGCLCGRACVISRFSRVQLFKTRWTVAQQAPLSMEFHRQECWSGLSCPLPGDLPDTGIKPASPLALALQVDS